MATSEDTSPTQKKSNYIAESSNFQHDIINKTLFSKAGLRGSHLIEILKMKLGYIFVYPTRLTVRYSLRVICP